MRDQENAYKGGAFLRLDAVRVVPHLRLAHSSGKDPAKGDGRENHNFLAGKATAKKNGKP